MRRQKPTKSAIVMNRKIKKDKLDKNKNLKNAETPRSP